MRLGDLDALRDALDGDPTVTQDVYDKLDAAPTVACCDCMDYEDCNIEDILRDVRKVEELEAEPGCSYFERREP